MQPGERIYTAREIIDAIMMNHLPDDELSASDVARIIEQISEED
jgi:ABC-type Zn uptake system ZnuABC Zn-binding protein ZnuA